MDSDHPISDLLQRLDPSETALLDWLVPQLDDSHLRKIAALDGGVMAAEFYQALKPIYERQPLPVPLTWMPRVVLDLGQWSSLDTPLPGCTPDESALSNSRETRDHLIRAFCCGVLLQAGDAPETHELLSSENCTLILLVDSVLRLGKEASESALRFLAWRVLRIPDDFEEMPFFAMAILLLRAALFEANQDSVDLSLLCEWVVTEEARVRAFLHESWTEEEWLLGLTIFGYRNEYWKIVAQEVLLDPMKAFPEPVASMSCDIAERLNYTGLPQ